MSDVKKEEGSAVEKVGYAWNDSDLYQGDGFEQMECGYPYQVMRGDTLQSIAQRFGILPRNIIDANELTPPFSVSPGQRLIIPADSWFGQVTLWCQLAGRTTYHGRILQSE